MQKKTYVSFLAVSLVATALLISSPAFAEKDSSSVGGFRGAGQMQRPIVVGKVVSVSGSTITVTSIVKMKSVTTTYTVDASKATVVKNGAASLVSGIAVGDMITIQGTVTGTSVVATAIRDGVGTQKVQPEIQGNGQPIVVGKVVTISGNTIIITNNSNVTFTIDATSAKVLMGNKTSTISSVAIGDNVVVQGTVNGNSVVASSVIDQKVKANINSNAKPQGFMGGIANFFKHLFGF